MGHAEFGGHRLADDDGARFPQGVHVGGVAKGLVIFPNGAAHLRRHVSSLEEILDTHGHAVHR